MMEINFTAKTFAESEKYLLIGDFSKKKFFHINI